MKTRLIKSGPMKGWREIVMPKVTWAECEERVEDAFRQAFLHAIEIVRRRRTRKQIIKALRREVPTSPVRGKAK